MMAHLLGFSPAQLFHNFFVAPTSVTVLNAEERIAGTAMFRTQVIGCTRHLAGLELVSASGYFTDAFQG
jgi:probable phosphoglycerate mutase